MYFDESNMIVMRDLGVIEKVVDKVYSTWPPESTIVALFNVSIIVVEIKGYKIYFIFSLQKDLIFEFKLNYQKQVITWKYSNLCHSMHSLFIV